MYMVYIPKYEGEKPDFLITKVIKNYISSTGSLNNTILCSPGYMSTKVNTIDEFYNKMENGIFNQSHPYNMGLFNGMNGTAGVSSGRTIREEHEYRIDLSSHLNLISVNCKNKKDHRKIMFFANASNTITHLDNSNYVSFMNCIKVHGVLIGSSNQSIQTYYGGTNGQKADKGEADILMFDNVESAYSILGDRDLSENVVVSKSMQEPTGGDNEYLKKILKDFLENSLA